MNNTLLVWETIPEKTDFYLIPNEVITDDDRNLLRKVHNHFVNLINDEDVSFALDDISYFLSEEVDEGYNGKWASFKVENTTNTILADINEVVLSGFVL